MRLLILTEGGNSIGMGHLSRCQAIAQAVTKINPRNEIQSLIAGRGLSLQSIPAELNAIVHNWQHTLSASLVRRADAVLVDSYKASEALLKKIASWNHRIFFIDDYNRVSYPAGTVVVPAPYFKNLRFPKKRGVRYLGGKDFIILRKPFWLKNKIKIKSAVQNILLTLGGTGKPALAEKIAAIAPISKVKFHAVVPRLSGSIKPGPYLKLYEKLNAEKMKSLMLKSDLAISAGGQTLYELASCGIPAVAYQAASNQEWNLKVLSKLGTILPGGIQGKAGFFEKIARQMNRLSDKRLRLKLSRAGLRLNAGRGALRFAKELYSQGRRDDFRIRPVQAKDCRVLWAWRNHPRIRRVSNNQELIPYREHQRWFDRQIKSKKCSLLLAVSENQNGLGHIRFTKCNPTTSCIHIYLAPGMIGKGFGSSVLIRSTAEYFKKHPKIREIEAEIFDSNEASARSFESAGFLFRGARIKNGRKLLIYTLRRSDV
jgi:UDP-2,4-diacetamido-2,4,6-trideoxy-beta-L-altropyranose hydrolase